MHWGSGKCAPRPDPRHSGIFPPPGSWGLLIPLPTRTSSHLARDNQKGLSACLSRGETCLLVEWDTWKPVPVCSPLFHPFLGVWVLSQILGSLSPHTLLHATPQPPSFCSLWLAGPLIKVWFLLECLLREQIEAMQEY